MLDVKLPLRALEEVAKLMAEAVFLAGFIQVLRQLKAPADLTPDPATAHPAE